ncbi:MAG: DUF1192 family protein [Parvibaculales bacterium]
MEEELQRLKGTPLADLLSESLETLSLNELETRKQLLSREIERIEAVMEQKKGSRDAAEALFGKSG